MALPTDPGTHKVLEGFVQFADGEERVLGRLHSWWQFRFVSSPLQRTRPLNSTTNTHISLVLQGEVRDAQKVGPRVGPRRKRGAHLVARQLARELGKHDGRQGVDVVP